MADRYDVLVIGSGAAGLSAALSARGKRVAVLSRGVLGLDGSSCWAQGGIAAALGPGDSPAQHAADTISAGGRHNNKSAVRWVAESAGDCIRWLISQGMQFDVVQGRLSLAREAAHCFPRVLHAGGDATGAELMRALREAVSRAPHIEVLEFTEALELITDGPRVIGAVCRDRRGISVPLYAEAVILATGGIGQLYRYTTNPAEADGTGLALAAAAGAELADLEFVQFHPTAMAPVAEQSTPQLPLISEALRGAGAVLVNARGQRFMAERHSQAELAPRDVVARAVYEQEQLGLQPSLDARPIGPSLPLRFPAFAAACRARGWNPLKEPIPIVPAAHYHMGGIRVDLHSASTIKGLYAVGEVACTGVHGANRLASNSLLEAVAFGRALGERLAARPANPASGRGDALLGMAARPASANDGLILGRLRQLMWTEAGILRSHDGLQSALQQVQLLERRSLAGSPALRQLLVARQLLTAALKRKESLGAHFLGATPVASGQHQAVA